MCLKWPPDLLADRLSDNLVARAGEPQLVVKRVSLQAAADRSYHIELLVEARPPLEATELWQVSLPAGPQDIESDLDLDTFVLIFRANLEEWWTARNYDPTIASYGRRIA